jgi:hypothetical protein
VQGNSSRAGTKLTSKAAGCDACMDQPVFAQEGTAALVSTWLPLGSLNFRRSFFERCRRVLAKHL